MLIGLSRKQNVKKASEENHSKLIHKHKGEAELCMTKRENGRK